MQGANLGALEAEMPTWFGEMLREVVVQMCHPTVWLGRASRTHVLIQPSTQEG